MRTAALIVALLFTPLAGAAYKCVDERGETQIGDTPPERCANVVIYEISPGGAVIRRIDPTPTAEQLRVREEERKRKAAADKIAADQKRKDVALLSTFASEKEFDTARDRNIEPLNGRIRSARERMKAIDERLAKIDEEMEFYTAGRSKGAKAVQPPQGLVAEQERLRGEKQALVAGIAAGEKDIVAQRERFEADKKRWLELKAGGTSIAERK